MAVEKSNLLDAQQREIRARLKALATRFPQAELARRTGTAPPNVHRYLREGKVPAEFCGALVSEFGVNPTWLFTGQGNMLRSDVSKPVAEMGGNLLELVDTMNAVSQLRLGSISDGKEQKQIRELGDAMRTFDRLRERLNVQTLPVITTVLDEFEAAVRKSDTETAAGVRQTAANLVRLTLNEDVLDRFEQSEASFLYLTAQGDRAIEYDRRSFSRHLRKGAIRDPESLAQALHLAMMLRETGHLHEARRICNATLALAADGGETLPDYLDMRLFGAHLDIDLGDVTRGLRTHFETYPKIEDRGRLASVLHTYAMLLTGAGTWEECLAIGPPTGGQCRTLLRVAYLLEDADRIAHAVKRFVGQPPARIPADEYELVLSGLILDLLQGRKRTVADYDRLKRDHQPRVRSAPLLGLLTALHRSSIARLARDNRALATGILEVETCLQSMPTELALKPEYYPMHLRNLRAVAKPAASHKHALANAQAHTEALVRSGLLLFEPFLKVAPPA